MTSPAQLKNKAAKKLGLFGTGQTLRSEHAADLDTAYAEVYGELELKDLVTWALDEEVPEAMTWCIVSMIAFARVNEYSVPQDKYQRIITDYAVAEPRLRTLLAKPRMSVTEIEEF